ncbi:tRNA-splicing endonuclease subunit Sen54 [Taenia crassiceps]|uniref:tRNA-splicing endonuclease subunit Sen54 n=1 Tax=Taenia crassiceps TaxID=6207 RepID=A0ABR4QLY1_9CEST
MTITDTREGAFCRPKLEKFLVGEGLLRTIKTNEEDTFTPVIFKGKAICNSPDPVVKERVSLNFFRQLHREYATAEYRVAQGHLVNGGRSREGHTCLVEVTAVRGKFMRRYGFSRREARYLYPEEAFYLSECGYLQVYDRGLPLSLQQLCNTVFRSAFEFSCYTAYAWLARQGFVLQRREATGNAPAGPSVKEVEPKVIDALVDPFPMIDVLKGAERPHSDDYAGFVMASPSDLIPIGEKALKEWTSSDRPPHLHCDDASADSTIASWVVFDVFDDRTGKFTKNRPVEPDFVFVVMLLEDGVRLLPNRKFRRRLGLSSKIQIVLAIVDNGDVYLQCAHPFSIPFLNQV